MAAVGDLVLILPAWGKGPYFNAGDTGVLTRLDADGDWWANIDSRENACIGVEGKYFAVTSRSPEVAQLQARVAELEGALRAALQVGHVLNFKQSNDGSADFNGKTADAVAEAYNGLRELARTAGVWTA